MEFHTVDSSSDTPFVAGTAAPRLRQLWLAGNPLHLGAHTAQQLQQLLPALDLLDGRALQSPPTCLVKSPASPHEPGKGVVEQVSHCVTSSSMTQMQSGVAEPRSWAIAAAAQMSSMEESQGQRYWCAKCRSTYALLCGGEVRSYIRSTISAVQYDSMFTIFQQDTLAGFIWIHEQKTWEGT